MPPESDFVRKPVDTAAHRAGSRTANGPA